MSPKKEQNLEVYKRARQVTGCSQDAWARLFSLSPTTNPAKYKLQPNVALKEAGKKGVNMPECLASELLRYLFENGYEVSQIEFTDEGAISTIPKRK